MMAFWDFSLEFGQARRGFFFLRVFEWLLQVECLLRRPVGSGLYSGVPDDVRVFDLCWFCRRIKDTPGE